MRLSIAAGKGAGRVSNYAPSWIDRNVWQIVTATIRLYPRMYVELCEGEAEIIDGRRPCEVKVTGGTLPDPTARIALKLADARRIELNRKCEAVSYCLSELMREHYLVVCLRFWGTGDTEEAFRAVKNGAALRGYRFDSIKSPLTVTEKGGYSLRNSKKIVHRFIFRVGRELGEI